MGGRAAGPPRRDLGPSKGVGPWATPRDLVPTGKWKGNRTMARICGAGDHSTPRGGGTTHVRTGESGVPMPNFREGRRRPGTGPPRRGGRDRRTRGSRAGPSPPPARTHTGPGHAAPSSPNAVGPIRETGRGADSKGEGGEVRANRRGGGQRLPMDRYATGRGGGQGEGGRCPPATVGDTEGHGLEKGDEQEGGLQAVHQEAVAGPRIGRRLSGALILILTLPHPRIDPAGEPTLTLPFVAAGGGRRPWALRDCSSDPAHQMIHTQSRVTVTTPPSA